MTCTKQDDYDPEVDAPAYQQRVHGKCDVDRDTSLHAFVCQKQEMVEAREIGNDLIEGAIGAMLREAEGALKGADPNSPLTPPTLREHIMQRLKEEELKPHLVAREEQPYQTCSLTTRLENETILEPEQWEQKYQQHPSKGPVLKSLSRWREAISFGIVRTNSVALIPPHRMGALDTCTLGLTPKVFKQAIEEWVNHVMPV